MKLQYLLWHNLIVALQWLGTLHRSVAQHWLYMNGSMAIKAVADLQHEELPSAWKAVAWGVTLSMEGCGMRSYPHHERLWHEELPSPWKAVAWGVTLTMKGCGMRSYPHHGRLWHEELPSAWKPVAWSRWQGLALLLSLLHLLSQAGIGSLPVNYD
jgi:hypothetical protein